MAKNINIPKKETERVLKYKIFNLIHTKEIQT